MAQQNYIDPEGYWIDPDRGIHRASFPDRWRTDVDSDCHAPMLGRGVAPHPRGIEDGLCSMLDQI